MELRAETSVFDDKLLKEDINNAQETADNAQVIAGTTAQYFWFLEEIGSVPEGVGTGAHITNLTKEEFLYNPANGGGNLLARSNGIAIRDGLTELAYFSGTAAQIGKSNSYNSYFDAQSFQIRNGSTLLSKFTSNGTDIYLANDSANSVASFGTTARIGKEASGHALVKSDGLHVWTGAESTDSNEVAFFGSTSRIGKSGQTYLEVTSAALNVYSNNGSKIVATLGEYTNGSGRLDIAGVSTVSGAYVYPAVIGLKGSADTDLVEMVCDRLRWGKMGTNHQYIELFRASDFSTLFLDGSTSDLNVQVSGHVYATNYIESSNRVEAGTRFKSEYCYTETISTDNRVAITSSGNMGKYKSSSRRYKDQIEDSRFNPHGLYELRARQFRYKDGYFALDDDNPHAYDLQVGFIAEEVEQYYPAAVVYDTDTGEIENWEERKIIPPMLTLIQELNDRLTKLEQKGAN